MKNWNFKKKTVRTFDKHIFQSIPHYKMFHKSIVELSRYHIRDNSTIIDIGTSTGTLLKSLYKKYNNKTRQFVGVDIEKAMIKECKKRYKNYNIDFIKADAIKIDYKNASIITIVLLLQFMTKKERLNLLEKIYKEIDYDSCVFIVEKIVTRDTRLHDAYSDLYYDFKRAKGLSDKEILDKNVALRGVMKLLDINEIENILKEIGFKVDVNIKYNNFISLLAIK